MFGLGARAKYRHHSLSYLLKLTLPPSLTGKTDRTWEEDNAGTVTILTTFLGTVSGAKHYRWMI